MNRVRMVGLCVVAACALTAMMSAVSASAETLPAVYECAKLSKSKVTKKYEGQYEKGCVTKNAKGEGEYEFQPWNLAAKKNKAKEFKDTKGGGSRLYIVSVGGVTCTKNTDAGYFTGSKTVGKIRVVFTGCELNGQKCQGESPKAANSGEVITNMLDGEIGYINKAAKEVGLVLRPESEPDFAAFHCGELQFVTSGAVIGRVTSAENVFTKEVTLKYQQEEGRQEPESFEGGPSEVLGTTIDGGIVWLSGEATVATNKGEELELVA